MNTLVLRTEADRLYCTLFSSQGTVGLRETVPGCRGPRGEAEFFTQALREIQERLPRRHTAIAVLVSFGGSEFSGPALYGEDTRPDLERLIPRAPMHLPVHLALLDSCRTVFSELPLVMVFETSFFARLPSREYGYGLPADLSDKLDLRRFGVHGLYHQAASDEVLARQRKNGQKQRPHILSVCLEPKLEIAAIIGKRPVMVTGGVSPLEGIPGETTCGELDPGIVLALVQKNAWGPEQVNNVLTRESGLRGLADRPATLPEIIISQSPEDELAYRVLRYRMLLACGSGVAAMGGLDYLVLSGRYASSGLSLGNQLVSQLPPSVARATIQSDPIVLERDLDSIIAEQAERLICAQRVRRSASESEKRF